jgi:hypothetical protein
MSRGWPLPPEKDTSGKPNAWDRIDWIIEEEEELCERYEAMMKFIDERKRERLARREEDEDE